MRLVRLLLALCLVPAFCIGAADEAGKDPSSMLLEQLLRDPVTNLASQAPQQGMTVKVYQLGNLRVDAPNGLRAIDVLRKWLPAGSSVTSVPATNSLHVLTTDATHAALVDLLAALDQPVAAAAPAADTQLKDAFEKFANNSIDPDGLKRIMGDAIKQSNVNLQQSEANLAERLAKDQRKFYLISGGFGAAVILLLMVFLFRTKKPETSSQSLVPINDRSLTAISRQLEQSKDAVATEVRLMLETALQVNRQAEAKRGSEHASLKTQLEVYLGRQSAVLEESRMAMEKTTLRLTESAESIKVSQQKNELLTEKLRSTLSEVDRIQKLIAQRDDKLDEQSEVLRDRELELQEVKNRLAQNMAKVAMLASSLGASDEFLNAPLPAFDGMVNGADPVPAFSNEPTGNQDEVTPVQADVDDPVPEPDPATENEAEAPTYEFNDPV